MAHEQKQSRIAKLESIISAAKLEIKELRRTMPRNKCAVRCSSCALLSRTKRGNMTDFSCPYRNFVFPTQKACDNHKPIVEANNEEINSNN